MTWCRVARLNGRSLLPAAVFVTLLVLPAEAGEPLADRMADTRIVRRANTAVLLSAAQIRISVLYRGGEFSTFWRQSPPTAGPPLETAVRRAPLERRLEDEWIAFDKAQHLTFSFLFTLGTQYAAVNKGGLSEHRALPISITSSALIGVTKEYYDLRVGPTHHFSVRDLVANAFGIVLAVGVILL